MNPNTELTIVDDKTFEVIRSAVNKMCNMVRPTFGPFGRKVIISKLTHFLTVDDGVQVARDFELSDPAENAVVRIIRETAVKTNDRVGDGTTGALIILQAIIEEVAKRKTSNIHKVEIELNRGLLEFKKILEKSTKQIKSKEELKKVALVSFKNEAIAEMVATVYSKLGKGGVVTIDKSSTMETTFEMG